MLINCPECNHEISNTAKSCPNCGYKFKRPFNKKLLLIIPVIIIIILTIQKFTQDPIIGYWEHLHPAHEMHPELPPLEELTFNSDNTLIYKWRDIGPKQQKLYTYFGTWEKIDPFTYNLKIDKLKDYDYEECKYNLEENKITLYNSFTKYERDFTKVYKLHLPL